jgi:small subunit ribosomal protein S11
MYKLSVLCTLNNTFASLSTHTGKCVAKTSAGCLKFRGGRKASRQAAVAVGSALGKQAEHCQQPISVSLTGSSDRKQHVLIGIQNSGVCVDKLVEFPQIAHNGCRAPKKRRI